MGQITVVCGTVHSDRRRRLDELWDRFGDRAIMLTPTPRAARQRQEAHARRNTRPGMWGTRAWELAAYARALIEGAGTPVRMVSMLERRLLARQALEQVAAQPGMPQVDMSSGLVRHMLRVITQLKQAAVEPDAFRAALKKATPHPFDNLTAAAYDAYQAALIEHQRYDVPGMYWEAERCCRSGAPLPGNPEAALLDGFDDFTLSQQRFLTALADRVEQLYIGLNYDVLPERRDLFLLQERWMTALKKAAPVREETLDTRAPISYSQYMARELFWRNPPPAPAGLRANARIIPCANPQHELESIGRQVRRLIREGAAPRRIAVALPDMAAQIGPLHAVFEEMGIPRTPRVHPPLLNTMAGALVWRLFDATEDWERSRVTSVLTSPLFHATPEEQTLLMEAPLLTRQAELVRGRDVWLPALDRLESMLQVDDRLEPGLRDRRLAALALLRSRLAALQAFEAAMPDRAPIADHAAALDGALDAFDMEKAVLTLGTAEQATREMTAVHALRGLLADLSLAHAAGMVLTRNDFTRLLRESMQELTVPAAVGPESGVVCCSLEQLRDVGADHVFIGGLNEGVFPRAAAVNAVYNEADLQRLSRSGLSLPDRRDHAFRERLAFHHALCTAEQSLTLSWRKQDTSGRELLPSPFVVELEDLFQRHGISISEAAPGPECFLPSLDALAAAREVENIAWFRNWPRLLEALPARDTSVDRRVAMESDRNSTAPFGLYDGCIQAPDLLARLADLFGPDRQFSVNQLESYLRFPFQFFLDRVLHIQETRIPENELDPMLRGSIAHDALRRFHATYVGESAATLLTRDESGARARMQQCAEEAFQRQARRMFSLTPSARRVELGRLEQALDRCLTRAATDFDGDCAPRYFEAVFGRAMMEDTDQLVSSEPFRLVLDDQTILLTGKIDRIDVSDASARIIDYKTSATPAKKDIVEGLSLQLTIYAWVLEQHLLPGLTCADAFYYAIFAPKKQEALLRKKAPECEARELAARARILEALRGIRSGQFPPAPALGREDAHMTPPSSARYEAWRIARKNPFYLEDMEEMDA